MHADRQVMHMPPGLFNSYARVYYSLLHKWMSPNQLLVLLLLLTSGLEPNCWVAFVFAQPRTWTVGIPWPSCRVNLDWGQGWFWGHLLSFACCPLRFRHGICSNFGFIHFWLVPIFIVLLLWLIQSLLCLSLIACFYFFLVPALEYLPVAALWFWQACGQSRPGNFNFPG